MSWIATAIIGGAVVSTIGGAIASSNASNAAQQSAQIQADAANRAAQIQYQMYGNTRNDLLSFQNVGRSAIPYMNGLIPGGFGTSNPAQPFNGQGAGGGQLAGVDSSGNPIYVGNAGANDDTTPMRFNGATGGLSNDTALTGGGSNPFLAAQLGNIPQLGGVAQGSLGSFTPGSGNSPLQNSLYSFVPGASGNQNPLLSAVNNSILGGGGIGNAALNNLTSFIPGANLANNGTLGNLDSSLGNYNFLLGGPKTPQMQAASQSQLDSINSNFKSAHDAWMKANPGKGEQEWANSDVVKNFNQNLMDYYKANPDKVGEGIQQAGAQADDPVYGSSAKTRLEALNKLAANPTSPQQTALENTPGYKFALDQGLKATQNGFAAQGLASSGAAMKGGAQFAEGLASQTYNQQLNNYLQSFNTNLGNYNSQFQNAYNAYNGTTNNALNAFNNQSNLAYNSYGQGFNNAFNMYGQQFNNANTGYQGQINNAYNLLTLGANAGAQTGTAGVQTANNAGNYLTSAGAANAAGIVGSANALNNGIMTGVNNFNNAGMMYAMLNGNGSFGGSVGNGLGGFQGYATPKYNV